MCSSNNNLSGCDLIGLSSSLAIWLGEELSSYNLALLSNFFSALGDNLGIISTTKSNNSDSNSNKDTNPENSTILGNP